MKFRLPFYFKIISPACVMGRGSTQFLKRSLEVLFSLKKTAMVISIFNCTFSAVMLRHFKTGVLRAIKIILGGPFSTLQCLRTVVATLFRCHTASFVM